MCKLLQITHKLITSEAADFYVLFSPMSCLLRFVTLQNVSWFTSEIRARLAP